jgi:hypothetical protein
VVDVSRRSQVSAVERKTSCVDSGEDPSHARALTDRALDNATKSHGCNGAPPKPRWSTSRRNPPTTTMGTLTIRQAEYPRPGDREPPQYLECLRRMQSD